MDHLPLFLNVARIETLIVGGGKVGRRRCEKVVACGGRVRVVDPLVCPDWFDLSQGTWISEGFAPKHLEGVGLVLACGPSEINELVTREALARNLWVGNSSNPESGNVIFPASGQRGPLAVALHTSGASPRFASDTLEAILESFTQDELQKLEILKELRSRFTQIADPIRKAKMLTLLEAFAR